MWDLIVSVPDHCLSFYFVSRALFYNDISNHSLKLKISPIAYLKRRLDQSVTEEDEITSTVNALF